MKMPTKKDFLCDEIVSHATGNWNKLPSYLINIDKWTLDVTDKQYEVAWKESLSVWRNNVVPC